MVPASGSIQDFILAQTKTPLHYMRRWINSLFSDPSPAPPSFLCYPLPTSSSLHMIYLPFSSLQNQKSCGLSIPAAAAAGCTAVVVCMAEVVWIAAVVCIIAIFTGNDRKDADGWFSSRNEFGMLCVCVSLISPRAGEEGFFTYSGTPTSKDESELKMGEGLRTLTPPKIAS